MKLIFNIKDEIDAQNILDLIKEEQLRVKDGFNAFKGESEKHNQLIEDQLQEHVDYLQSLYDSATLVYDTPQEDKGWNLDNFDPDGEMADEEWSLED